MYIYVTCAFVRTHRGGRSKKSKTGYYRAWRAWQGKDRLTGQEDHKPGTCANEREREREKKGSSIDMQVCVSMTQVITLHCMTPCQRVHLGIMISACVCVYIRACGNGTVERIRLVEESAGKGHGRFTAKRAKQLLSQWRAWCFATGPAILMLSEQQLKRHLLGDSCILMW